LSPFFVVAAIVTVLFGLAFLIIPDQIVGWYGVAVDDASRLMGRFFGSALIALAIVIFMARDLGPSPTLTGILWAGLVADGIPALLNLWASATGLVNGLGWVTMVINILFAAGFGYFLFVAPAQKV
jgi:uncharacterized membrane protein